MKQEKTRSHILAVSLRLAAKHGYRNITRDQIAIGAKVPPSLISYHLGTMIELRRHIMREAVRRECLAVIAQGLAAQDKHAAKAPPHVRQEALDSLNKG